MLRRPFTDGHRYAEFLPDAEGLVERRHSPAAIVSPSATWMPAIRPPSG